MYEKTSAIIGHLTDYLYPQLSVWFQVHGRSDGTDWAMCVACSQEHHIHRVGEILSKSLSLIEQSHYDKGINIGTKMKVTLSGSYSIRESIALQYVLDHFMVISLIDDLHLEVISFTFSTDSFLTL